MQTYEQVLIETTSRLEASGSNTPKLDAIMLLCHVTGKDKIQIYAHPRTQLNQEEYARFEALVARREKAEPMAYILGQKGFWDIDLTVTRDVLIPRPDTETLLEVVFDAYPGKTEPLSFCELGSGSGAIILSLLKTYPEATGVAIDTSKAARACTKQNARNLKLAERLEVRESNWFSDVKTDEIFDAIVSNPPYIPSGDMAGLMRDVRLYEPPEALDGGTDGLDAYREIIKQAPDYLKAGGLLALEVGQGQAPAVISLLAERGGFSPAGTRKDLAGIERVVFARAL